jgi:phosphoribosylformylglycinamidine (FGAM) synthase-like enzyme
MTPYEMMLSESQERMLMVLRPGRRSRSRSHLPQVGSGLRRCRQDHRRPAGFRCMWNGEEVANMPIKELGDEAPEYDRPWVEPKVPAALAREDVPAPNDLAAAVMKMMGSPDMSSPPLGVGAV